MTGSEQEGVVGMSENPDRRAEGDLESAADDEREAGGQTAGRGSGAPTEGDGIGATVEPGAATTFEPEEDPHG